MNGAAPQMSPRASRFFLALAALALVAFVLILASRAGAAQAQAANGKYDTDGDGLIEISNLEQLDAIRYDPDGDGAVLSSDTNSYAPAYPVGTGEEVCATGCRGYELTRSLDFDDPGSYASGSVNAAWTTGEGWAPIRRWGSSLVGSWDEFDATATFNGNGYVISNLYINGFHDEYILGGGLFSSIYRDGIVMDVGLVDIKVSFPYGGGLVGKNFGSISRCYVNGDVSATVDHDADRAHAGGMVGNNEGSIVDSYTTSNVSGDGADYLYSGEHGRKRVSTNYVGGLAGHNSGSIVDSYATGEVSATGTASSNFAGGLVGSNRHSGRITASYAAGDVSSVRNAGGLVGENSAYITASYATGEVSTDSRRAGGLVGVNYYRGGDGIITASYATGYVDSPDTSKNWSGLIGSTGRYSEHRLTDNYWDTQTSGQVFGVGRDWDFRGVTGKTTAELQAPTGYTGIYAGWNVDLDNADGDDDLATGGDAPWDFGTSSQYPALKGIPLGNQRTSKPTVTPTPTPTPTPAPEVIGDRLALISFYNTMGGTAWERSENWGTDVPLDEWQGVLTDDDGRVIILNLQSNNLTGNVPPEMVNLTALRELRLQGNELSGPIPAWLSSNELSNLELLNLSENRLSGEIPASLADLPSLTTLWLHDNQFTGCAPRVLTGLVTTGRGALPDFCPIPEHPEERAALAAFYNATVLDDLIEDLTWRVNRYGLWQEQLDNELASPLQVFVDCIEDFENRWTLGTVTPVEFLELLELLRVATDPPITRPGCLKEEHYVVTALIVLEELVDRGEYSKRFRWALRDGWDTDTPLDEWYGVEIDDIDGHVIELNLSGNNLDGEISSELSSLRSLEQLDLSGNLLSGTIPAALGELRSLERLDLSGNLLRGTIPWQLSEIENLSDVNLSDNGLTGQIPPQLGRIIPSEGGSLKTLYLYDNDLEGCIPRSLLALLTDDAHRVKEKLDIALRTDNLRDVILPVVFERAWEGWILPTYGLWLPPCPPLPSYEEKAQNEAEKGPAYAIPPDSLLRSNEQTGLTDLEALKAIRAHFILSEGNSDRVQEEFFGHGEKSWSDSNLNDWSKYEDCGPGKWHGVWTKHMNSGCRVVKLELNKRELKGNIPWQIGNLGKLQRLDLSQNCLSGPIPPELGNLSELKVLGLNIQGKPNDKKGNGVDECFSTESLRGELPAELGNLGALTQLNLFDNPGLTGELPPEFGNLAELEHVKLENTDFSGCVPPPLVQNFADPVITKVAAPLLAFGAVTAFTGGTGITFTFLQMRILGPLVSKVIGTVLDPVIKPGAEHWLPWVGSELHNVKLYCDGTTVAARVGAVLSLNDRPPRMIRIGSPVPVTATFSEAVSGFTVDDVTTGNGTVGNFSGNGAVYTFEVTPGAIGQVTVDIEANVAEDADGNGNKAALQLQLGIPYDDNRNGVIERNEVIRAITDYRRGDGSVKRSHVIALINLYRSPPAGS